jgi:hypothetical protein
LTRLVSAPQFDEELSNDAFNPKLRHYSAATAQSQLAKLESPLTMSAERGTAVFDRAFMAGGSLRASTRPTLIQRQA